jgi:hypothetical protein
MGVNAQTAVPAFVAGEVLTAAEMTQVNTGIPVFATTVTRDAAFGGAGEKVLAQGQYAYIEATSSLMVYSGSAWIAAGQTPGLACVKAETTVTASNSVTADGVFTSSFTNYLVLVNYTINGSGQLKIKLRASGTAASTNYNLQYIEAFSTSISTATVASATSYIVGAYGQGLEAAVSIELFGPQLAKATSIQTTNTATLAAGYTAPLLQIWNGNHSTATAYDGIEIFTTGINWSGTYAIYGFSKTL